MISEDASGAAIARQTGIPASTISRWFSGEFDPKPRQVVQVARAYGTSPLQALIAADFLSPEDVDLPENTPRQLQIRDFTELELAREIVRRVEEGSSPVLEAPLDGAHPAMNVSPMQKPVKKRFLDAPMYPTPNRTDPEAAKKKAALRDPEMNNDESFE